MQVPLTMRQRLEAARAEGRILLGGHRGNPAEHPENTLASFQSAIEVGCDLVDTIEPKQMSVVSVWNVRGGIATTVRASFPYPFRQIDTARVAD